MEIRFPYFRFLHFLIFWELFGTEAKFWEFRESLHGDPVYFPTYVGGIFLLDKIKRIFRSGNFFHFVGFLFCRHQEKMSGRHEVWNIETLSYNRRYHVKMMKSGLSLFFGTHNFHSHTIYGEMIKCLWKNNTHISRYVGT